MDISYETYSAHQTGRQANEHCPTIPNALKWNSFKNIRLKFVILNKPRCCQIAKENRQNKGAKFEKIVAVF